ncbi:MAG: CRTAC1 family protein [Microthrixaceae bacterium]
MDGDNDLDLFVGGVGAHPDRLYLGDGEGGFNEAAKDRGLGEFATTEGSAVGGYATMGAAFSDWDRDGDLDLMTTQWAAPAWDASGGYASGENSGLCGERRSTGLAAGDSGPRSRMYSNDGTGSFTEVTSKLGVDLASVSAFTPVFADYNDDAWPDLFLTGDFCTSRLYRNNGPSGFVDVTARAGLGTDENGMGSVVEDLNADGTLDWFITSIAPGPNRVGCVAQQFTVGCSGNRLYLGRGDDFLDATDDFGVRESAWAWGAAGEDLDNDGRRDLVVVSGYLDVGGSATGPGDVKAAEFFRRGHPSLWRGSPGGPWVDQAEALGLTYDGQAKAIVPLDHDGDGDLDLFVGYTTSLPKLFRNELTEGGHWIELRLHDATTPNTRAVGARVRLDGVADDEVVVGEVRSGSGYQSSSPGRVHIGLGDREDVDTIAVRWPDSESYETYDLSAVDTTIEIERDS